MIKGSLVLILVSVIGVGGYAFMNYRKFDYFAMTSFTGFVLSAKTLRIIERLPDEHAKIREVLIAARDADLVRPGGQHTGYGYIYYEGVIPELMNVTGLQMAQLSKFMLRINLLLIREAPQEYLWEVFRTFSTYWFPSSTSLANMDRRALQLLWALIHFLVMSVFFVTLVIRIGQIIDSTMCGRLLERSESSMAKELSLSQLQGFAYSVAGTVVIYTALISNLVEIGDPRMRAPTDSLIIFMCFLGADLWRRWIQIRNETMAELLRYSSKK
jgi:hypothetical protein